MRNEDHNFSIPTKSEAISRLNRVYDKFAAHERTASNQRSMVRLYALLLEKKHLDLIIRWIDANAGGRDSRARARENIVATLLFAHRICDLADIASNNRVVIVADIVVANADGRQGADFIMTVQNHLISNGVIVQDRHILSLFDGSLLETRKLADDALDQRLIESLSLFEKARSMILD